MNMCVCEWLHVCMFVCADLCVHLCIRRYIMTLQRTCLASRHETESSAQAHFAPQLKLSISSEAFDLLQNPCLQLPI